MFKYIHTIMHTIQIMHTTYDGVKNQLKCTIKHIENLFTLCITIVKNKGKGNCQNLHIINLMIKKKAITRML